MSTASPITLPDSPLVWTVADAAAVTKRNLYRYIRVPTLLLFSTIQPVMFVLLFTYVFGGSIRVPGVDHYVDYLIRYPVWSRVQGRGQQHAEAVHSLKRSTVYQGFMAHARAGYRS
jgi:hypothetical protein